MSLVTKLVPVLLLVFLGASLTLQDDSTGYVVYCPCMGRFGNQAEHFLGMLAFTKGLNRTLIVPPWVEYPRTQPKSHQEPYASYFSLDALSQYLPVISMEDFMETKAKEIWPPGQRTVFCYGPRDGKGTCNAKDGNPFGPFWDTFNIDFDDSQFYKGMSIDTLVKGAPEQWNKKFPVSRYPVLAFAGAPAAFPMSWKHVDLMQYVVWSDRVQRDTDRFIEENVVRPYVGLHLRVGSDWIRACEHVNDDIQRHMFGSPQCLGYNMEHGRMSKNLCDPPKRTVLKQIKETVKKIKAKTVFVAADDFKMYHEIEELFKGKPINVVRHEPADPHVDLALLTQADHYIGNCLSTFSAFATRYRMTHGNLPNSFWAFKPNKHDEL